MHALRRLFLVVAAIGLGYLAFLAVTLQINHFDTYSVLNNARLIAVGGDYPYELIRPPLLSLLVSLFFFLPLGPSEIVIAARLFSVGIFVVYLLFAYRIFSLHLQRSWALLGASLLALNPLLIADAPFAREDMLGAMLTAGTFYYYARWRRGDSRLSRAGIFLSLAAVSRYNLGPLLILTLFLLEAARGRGAGSWGERIGFLCALPAAAFLLLTGTLYWKIGLTDFWRAPVFVLEQLSGYFLFLQKQSGLYAESPAEVFGFLLHACSWPLLALGAGGMIAAVRQRREGWNIHLAWAAVFLIFHVFILGHKEARYLTVFFVPLYFFALIGMETLTAWLARRAPARSRAATIALIVVVAVLPVQMAARALLRFRDPVYHEDFQRRMSLSAQAWAGGKGVYWIGRMYAMHPRDHVFHPDDEVAFIYHFYNNAVRFFTGEEVIDYYAPVLYNGNSLYIPGILPYIVEDAVLIVNPAPEDHITRTLPERLPPLLTTKARVYTFTRDPGSASGYVSAELPGGRLEIARQPDGLKLIGTNLPRTGFELYAADEAGAFTSKGLFAPAESRIDEFDLSEDLKTQEIKMLTFPEIK